MFHSGFFQCLITVFFLSLLSIKLVLLIDVGWDDDSRVVRCYLRPSKLFNFCLTDTNNLFAIVRLLCVVSAVSIIVLIKGNVEENRR